MSSNTIPGPDSRLFLGHSGIHLVTGEVTVATVNPADPDFSNEFCTLCAKIPDRGRGLSVILPDEEVWKGRVATNIKTPSGYAEAVETGANGLDLPPGSVVLATGRADTDSGTPIAAIRKTTLRETQAFLSEYGITAHTLSCDWDVSGFADQERFAANTPVAASLKRRMILATSALAACLVLGVFMLQGRGSPIADEAPVPVAESTLSATPEPVLEIAGAPAPPREDPGFDAKPAIASKPVARPQPVLVAKDSPAPPQARVTPPTAPLVPTILSSRNAPDFPQETFSSTPPAPPQSNAHAVLLKTTVAALRRSGSADILDVPEATGPRIASTALRPLHRPGDRNIPLKPAVAAGAGANKAASLRPRPRLVSGNKILNAAIATAVTQAAGTSVGVRPSNASVAALNAARPLPRRIRITPSVKTKSGTTFKKAPPAVVRKAEPAPKKQAAPARTGTANVRVGLERNEISLVGLFGSSRHRRAILMLPGGQVRKVRPGDRINSLRVASVGTKSVRLTGRGRDTILKLP